MTGLLHKPTSKSKSKSKRHQQRTTITINQKHIEDITTMKFERDRERRCSERVNKKTEQLEYTTCVPEKLITTLLQLVVSCCGLIKIYELKT